MLMFGVSRRRLPLLDCHMRDADGIGGALPPAGCVLVAHSEHEGGIGGTGGTEGGATVRKFITLFQTQEATRFWVGAGFRCRSASRAATNVLF